MATKYTIWTTTGKNDADHTPRIRLGGTLDVSHQSETDWKSWFELDNPGRDDLERGKTDKFVVTSDRDLGDIVKIWLRMPTKDDHWSVDTIKIKKQKPNARTTVFSMDQLLKTTVKPWVADGVSEKPRVSVNSKPYVRKLFTEFYKIDNTRGKTDVEETITVEHEKEAVVRADKSEGATKEDSWFLQVGYTPSQQTGGVDFSAGYAGKVVATTESRTGQSHRQKVRFTQSRKYSVKAESCVVVQVDWFESGKTGEIDFFGGKLPFMQANKLSADFTIYGTYWSREDVPNFRYA